MDKNNIPTSEDVRSSVVSLYADVLDKRRVEREAALEKKRLEKEAKEKEKEEKKKNPDGTKMTKKQRKEAELNNWREILVGLTGEDLEYSDSKKRKKKKYRKWIGEDAPSTDKKVKKSKKKNYKKEFEPELNMLKNIVADQNRFTADLQRRFQNAAGPATKDATPLNKTLVELAAAINASRSNSLGMLREIGSLKKTVAELYLKQLKEAGADAGYNPTDIGLMGSGIASGMFNDIRTMSSTPVDLNPTSGTPSAEPRGPIQATASPLSAIEDFDPSTWGGPTLDSDAVKYENIDKSYVVEWKKSENLARFKAIDNQTGKEIVGCPVPTPDPSRLTFNEKDLTAKDDFDQVYKLEIV